LGVGRIRNRRPRSGGLRAWDCISETRFLVRENRLRAPERMVARFTVPQEGLAASAVS